MTLTVEAINRTTGQALLSDSSVVNVTTWIGADGRTLKTGRNALACVVALPDGRWATVDLRQFDEARMQ